MKLRIFLMVPLLVIIIGGIPVTAMADPPGGLPPGLEKNVERGKPLPPGWQKKLAVGNRLDHETYRRGHVIHRRDGYVTLSVEGKLLRVVAGTLEIVEILDSLD